MGIANKIRDARESARLSQQALADKIGTSQQQIHLYETDQSGISIEKLTAIANTTGKPVGWFFGEEPGPPENELCTKEDLAQVMSRLDALQNSLVDMPLKIMALENVLKNRKDLKSFTKEEYFQVLDRELDRIRTLTRGATTPGA